ncbi:hypothetical protein J437_LFUL002442 [Ladona fulva]|uniref:Uncharacterized protein n=1 Tax=Ladona fulva TaxID=123851 RepID=A0A8K0KP33_LADFU|nr:hypothetical protein J437_LFUL002442 [Ladona fulva]
MCINFTGNTQPNTIQHQRHSTSKNNKIIPLRGRQHSSSQRTESQWNHQENNEYLRKIRKWSQQWKLRLNPAKSAFINFTKKSSPQYSPKTTSKIHNVHIPRETDHKFLGNANLATQHKKPSVKKQQDPTLQIHATTTSDIRRLLNQTWPKKQHQEIRNNTKQNATLPDILIAISKTKRNLKNSQHQGRKRTDHRTSQKI